MKSEELYNTYIKTARIDISKSCSEIKQLQFKNFNLMNKFKVLEEKIKILEAENENFKGYLQNYQELAIFFLG